MSDKLTKLTDVATVFGPADVEYNENKNVTVRVCVEGNVMTVFADCAEETSVDFFRITANYSYGENCRVFANGFQSWTDSLEYPASAKQYAPSSLIRNLVYGKLAKKTGFSCSGDYDIYKPVHRAGRFYGFSYGYVRNGDSFSVIGSLDDSTGYTILDFDVAESKIYISVDLKGRRLEKGENVVCRTGIFNGGYDEAFDSYFAATGVKCLPCPLKKGYTTWYNYYADIDSNIIDRDLEALSGCGIGTDVFQIDDGYEKAVGDWLEVKPGFFTVLNDIRKDLAANGKDVAQLDENSGMKPIAEMIHGKGMLAGIWLAPFSVTPKSDVFRKHKDWLIKDKKGKPVKAGSNWGGFYALDIYNEEARAHIRKVFDVVLGEWGFDLVKLDFLYSAAFVPRDGKCRAKIMYDAMDFLRECVGDKLILGCGVPLMPAFGKVDYCRIGPDISLDWGKKDLDVREGISTSHAIANSSFRRHLDGRAFGNDPDVFLLRNPNNSMTFRQKKALSEINKLFGSVLFTSDNVSEYNDLQYSALKHVFDGRRAKIVDVTMDEKFNLSVRYDYGDGEKGLKIALYSGAINRGDTSPLYELEDARMPENIRKKSDIKN